MTIAAPDCVGLCCRSGNARSGSALVRNRSSHRINPCAESSATSDRRRFFLSSLRGCAALSIAATTRRASRSAAPAARCFRCAARRASCKILRKSLKEHPLDGTFRHRAHPLGHARTSHGRECASASRLHRPHRCGPQRHRRKLSRLEARTDRAGPQVRYRNRHGDHRAPDRADSERS